MPIAISEITQYLEQHSVTNYAALPAANTVPNELWYCINEQGTKWLFTYKSAGWYFSDGINWTHQESAFQASQAETDAGLLSDKFVSPNTLANSTWAFTTAKVLSTLLTGLNTALSGTIASSDTILQAFGKIQNSITSILLIIAPAVSELLPVISQINTPPGSPSTGDRYLVGTSPVGAWSANANHVAEWDGVSWVYTIPVNNNTVFVTNTLTTLRFNGTSWVAYTGTAILQNGNSLGSPVSIGSNDSQDVRFKRFGVNQIELTSLGTKIPQLAGANQRVVEASPTGIPSATKELIAGYLSAGATATLLTTTSNWSNVGVYTGAAITGTYQGQMYSDSNYFFIAIADNVWIRLIRG